VEDTDEILKRNPGSVIFARYSDDLVRKGNINEAIEILEKGIQANPQYAPGHSVLADILFIRNSYEKAAEELKIALHFDPQMPKDIFRLGKYFLQQNQSEKAIQHLLNAQRFEPLEEDVRYTLEEARLKDTVPEDPSLSTKTQSVLSEISESPGSEKVETAESLPEYAEMVEGEQEQEESITELVETGTVPESEEDRQIAIEEGKPEVVEPADEAETDDQLSRDESESIKKLISQEIEHLVSEDHEEIESLLTSEKEDVQVDEVPSSGEPPAEDSVGQTIEEEVTGDELGYTEIVEDEQIFGKDIEDENILEINDEEEYDQLRSEIVTSAIDVEETSFLSEDERAELLSYENVTEQTGSQTPEDNQVEKIETDEKLADSEKVTEPESSVDSMFKDGSSVSVSELSREEMDVLSDSGTVSEEDDKDLQLGIEEGIDYSDITSEDKLTLDSEELRDIGQAETGEVAFEKEDIPGKDRGDNNDYSLPEMEMWDVHEPGNVVTEEDTEIESPSISEENPQSEARIPEGDNSLRIVKEVIKSAPDIGYTTIEEKETDDSEEKLDKLIAEYENSIKEDSTLSQREGLQSDTQRDTDGNSPVMPSEENQDITATMAEIFVAQNLISRAIDIYKILLERNVGNEMIISRLEELEKMSDEQSDKS